MILSNLTTVWVIGGYDDCETVGSVFIFNSVTMQWTLGVTLQYPRYLHSCSMILINNQTMSQAQIVVGGFPLTNLVEIFDYQSNSWICGPQLPIDVRGAAIVNDANYGVILINGYSYTARGYLDTLYQLQHGASQWVKMKINPRTPLAGSMAFYIPHNITNCT